LSRNVNNDEFIQRRKARQRKIRKRRITIFLTFFIILLLVVGIVLSLTVFFPIKNITAKGSKLYTSDEIIAYSSIKNGDNLFTVSEEKTLEKLRLSLPFVETVEFSRSLPDTLNIKVTDAKEYVCFENNGKYYSVSKSNWVLASYDEKPKDLMEIKASKVKCKIGTEVEFSDQEKLEHIADLLKRYELEVSYIDITDDLSIKAKINGRFEVDFGTTENLEPKIKHLISMMENIGKKKKGRINLSMWTAQKTEGIFVEN
jgi:cell division protein FtsQ